MQFFTPDGTFTNAPDFTKVGPSVPARRLFVCIITPHPHLSFPPLVESHHQPRPRPQPPPQQEEADTTFGSWLFGHSIPPLFKFSMERSMELFSGPIRVHALFFADAEGKDYAKISGAIKDAAVKYRTQVCG